MLMPAGSALAMIRPQMIKYDTVLRLLEQPRSWLVEDAFLPFSVICMPNGINLPRHHYELRGARR